MFKRLLCLLLLSGCTNFSTTLNTGKHINMDSVREGKACGHYILGSIDASWVGVIGYRFKGSESAFEAAEKAGITKPIAIDHLNKNYLFYTKKCVIVRGESISTQ